LGQEKQSLHYEVKVNMQVIPVFALDKQGNPCFDLKKEELTLFVNGKATPINLLNRYEFTDSRREINQQAIRPNLPPKRYVFIIIDSIFNSLTGLRRSKEIAHGLVDNLPESDAILLLENNNGSGLKLVVGPSKDKAVLNNRINRIKQLPEIRMNMRKHNEKIRMLDASQSLLSLEAKHFNEEQKKKDRESEQNRYKTDMKYFSHVLSQFKYTLNSITRPKIVFLISEGVSRGAFLEEWNLHGSSSAEDYSAINNQGFYFDYLKKIARTINEGGSLMIAINPRQATIGDNRDSTGKESLKYLADESGGRYFAGMDTQKIAERIKKTTSAYYELFFAVDDSVGQSLSIKLKSNRKGVRINTVRHNEKELPYAAMPGMQKQLFVLDIINGGMWSRMTSTVGKPDYVEIDNKRQNGKTVKTIEVTLPRQMRDKKLDIYTLQMDAVTKYADIKSENRVVGDNVRIQIEILWDRIPYFAIVEPDTIFCIYNRVNKD
jgi:VWFA-related protein